MATETFTLLPKASISLSMQAQQPPEVRLRMAAARSAAGSVAAPGTDEVTEAPPTSVIVETRNVDAVAERVGDAAEIERLSESYVSVRADATTLAELSRLAPVRRVQTKKLAQPHLDAALPSIGLAAPGVARPVAEDGTGVLVGIVDTGFDLSHPMFRDAAGKLRVDGLLDQSRPGSPEFTTAQLERSWAAGVGHGSDGQGHGTHVASTAAGTRFGALEGVAPGARLLLVKSDFINTANAVSWVFRKAGATPCVVNLSLGHHFGAHDGSDAEERLHEQLTGPGKIIVISAGNERNDDIHIGGRFAAGQSEDATFDLLRQADGSSSVALTLWHSRDDRFTVSLVRPGGEVVAGPPLGRAVRQTFAASTVEIGHLRYPASKLIQHQVVVEVKNRAAAGDLRGWRVRIGCRTATVGRIDGWFNNSGLAAFRPHPMLEAARTVGLAATGAGCLAVASHVSRTSWTSDQGVMQDNQSVVGRSSSFSSLGPTRDGQQKPDLSAPGQWITAGLAAGSDEAADDRFADNAGRMLTIAGTSMAAPVVTGAVALLLQQDPTRTLAQVRDKLTRSARRDAHTGPGPWDPTYGVGKLDIAAALRV